jgi:hypothetical protein
VIEVKDHEHVQKRPWRKQQQIVDIVQKAVCWRQGTEPTLVTWLYLRSDVVDDLDAVIQIQVVLLEESGQVKPMFPATMLQSGRCGRRSAFAEQAQSGGLITGVCRTKQQ